MAEPLFITTDQGNVIPWAELAAYKAEGSGESSRVLAKDRFDSDYLADGLVRPLYDMETLANLLELNTWHNRACQVKAQDVAGLGYSFVKEEKEGEDQDETGEERKVKDFFSNEEAHGKTIDRVLTNVQLDGEALGVMAIELVRLGYAPDGEPVRLSHVPAHMVRAHKDGNKYCQKRGTTKRWFKAIGYEADVDYRTGEEYELGTLDPDKRATEIIWDNAYSGRSDFYGLPQIIPALGAMEGMVALRNYNLDFFRHYGIPSYAVYISGDYNLGKKTRIRKETDGTGTIGEVYDSTNPDHTACNFEYPIINEIKSRLSKVATNPHSPIILAVPAASPDAKVEIKFVPLAVDVKESSFRLYRKDNRDEIIAAHGVPSYRLGLVETGSLGGSVATESNRIYRDSVIRPRKRNLETLLNVYVIRGAFEVKTLSLRFNDLDLAEEDHEKDIAGFLVSNGAMTPNEIREYFGGRFGLTRDENNPALDQYYINGSPIGESPQGEFIEAVKGFHGDLATIALKDRGSE